MNETEKLEEKLKTMDKAYFNRIKECEKTKDTLELLCIFETVFIFICIGINILL